MFTKWNTKFAYQKNIKVSAILQAEWIHQSHFSIISVYCLKLSYNENKEAQLRAEADRLGRLSSIGVWTWDIWLPCDSIPSWYIPSYTFFKI